ncbi:MAG: hypothetical protein GX957_03610 [Clostridiaceae bacterium]|nr:hypothetical protein [Clostridiaceae bacterium]
MLFQPTNVYPNKVTLSINEAGNPTVPIVFTVNGDGIKYRDWRFYDADTRKLISPYYGKWDNGYYRGEEFRANIPVEGTYETMVHGGNYFWNVRLFQDQYDILKVTGVIRNSGLSHTNDVVYVSYGVSNIIAPVSYDFDGETIEVGACYLVAQTSTGIERKKIIEYQNADSQKVLSPDGDYVSKIILESAFSENITGKPYRVEANWIQSPDYYFQLRNDPTATITAEFQDDYSVSLSAEYSQAQGVNIQWYQWSIDAYVDMGINEIKLATEFIKSNKKYTGKIEFSFIPFLGDYGSPVKYKIHLTVCTLDNVQKTIEYEYTPSIAHENIDIIYDSLEKGFDDIQTYFSLKNITYGDGQKIKGYVIEKLESQTGNIFNGDYKPIAKRISTSGISAINASDINVSSGKKYFYRIIPILQNGSIGNVIGTGEISPEFNRWSLTALKENLTFYDPVSEMTKDELYGFNKPVYSRPEKTWYFDLDTEDAENDMIQNFSRTFSPSYSRFSRVTSLNNNYLSGGLTCKLSQMVCDEDISQVTDDIYLVEKWRKFLHDYNLFLLKNPKGDVLIVSIHENPSTKYNYNVNDITTSVSFNWVEVMSVDDIIII